MINNKLLLLWQNGDFVAVMYNSTSTSPTMADPFRGLSLGDMRKSAVSPPLPATIEVLPPSRFQSLTMNLKSMSRAALSGAQEHIGHAAPEVANFVSQDKILKSIATTGYKFLPPLLKKFIPEAAFVAFFIKNKDTISHLVGLGLKKLAGQKKSTIDNVT